MIDESSLVKAVVGTDQQELRMREIPWVLVEESVGWRAGRVSRGRIEWLDAAASDARSSANDVSSAIERMKAGGYRGEHVLLGVHSLRCLCGKFVSSENPRRLSHQAKLFQFESQLPVSVEDVVADFSVTDRAVFGVAIQIRDYLPLLGECEAAGIAVRTITPWALLAAQEIASSEESRGCRIALFPQSGYVELFALEGRNTATWKIVADAPTDVLRELLVVKRQQGTNLCITVYGNAVEFHRALTSRTDLDIELRTMTGEELIADGRLVDILAGRRHPAIDLRRDQLGDTHRWQAAMPLLQLTFTACMVALLAIIGAFILRGRQYERLAQELHREQRRTFHELFPDQRVPMGVRARLESELAKASALRGVPDSVPVLRPSLPLLSRLLDAVPETVRIRILRVDIEGAQVSIEAQVRNHGDAGIIAESMRSHGFHVLPPRTVQTARGVIALHLTAEYPSQAEVAMKNGELS